MIWSELITGPDLYQLVVHDVIPAYAGITSHLLSVATLTPALSENAGYQLPVAYLGNVDMETPLASMVVSETVDVPKFDPSLHQDKMTCILSITGCDMDELEGVGLSGVSVPMLSLPQIWSLREQFDAQSYSSFGEFAKRYSLSPKAVGEIFADRFEQHCHDEQTVLFIADCVTALTRVIYQIDKDKKIALI